MLLLISLNHNEMQPQSVMDWSLEYQVTFGVAILSLILCFYWRRRDSAKYPDGPFRLPIIGNLPQMIMAGGMVNFLEKYRKIYGNVYTIEFGGAKRVVVCGFDNAKNLLVKNADYTSNRTTKTFPASFEETSKKTPGILFGDYPSWKHLRTFATSVLRHEGMGQAAMEPKIMSEVEQYIAHFIEPILGKPIDMSLSMTLATSNVIIQMINGKRYEYGDPEISALNSAIIRSLEANMKSAIVRNIPFTSYLPGNILGRRAQEQADEIILGVSKRWMEHARRNLNTEDQNSFMHQALLYAESEKEKGNSEAFYSDGNIQLSAQQIYIAGTESTSTTLKWALLYLMRYPEVERRVRNEIHDVLGERTVTMKDKILLPYVDAIFYETSRYSVIGVTLLPHTLEKELMVEGKTIPAGADLLVSLAAMANDTEVFPEPEKFKPERFLGENGPVLKNKLLMFGTGRRACPGEPLARMEFLLFFVTFLQRYKISYLPGEVLSEDAIEGLLRAPKNYEIIFERF